MNLVGSTFATGGSPPITCALPSGSAAGDVALILVQDSSSSGKPTTTGWTFLGTDTTTSDFHWYRRALTSADITAGSITLTASGGWNIELYVIRGVAVAGALLQRTSATSVNSTSITGHAAGTLPWFALYRVLSFLPSPSSGVGWPTDITGASETVLLTFSSTDQRRSVGWLAQTIPGTLPAETVTLSGTASNLWTSLVLLVMTDDGTNIVSPSSAGYLDITSPEVPIVVDLASDASLVIDAVPTDFPGPPEPTVTLLAPTASESTHTSTQYTYGALILDSNGRVTGDWGPS